MFLPILAWWGDITRVNGFVLRSTSHYIVDEQLRIQGKAIHQICVAARHGAGARTQIYSSAKAL
jgi:hypothetical protein